HGLDPRAPRAGPGRPADRRRGGRRADVPAVVAALLLDHARRAARSAAPAARPAGRPDSRHARRAGAYGRARSARTTASTHREMNDPSVWPPCLAPVSETPRPGIRGGGGGGVFGLFVGALTLTQEYRSLRRRGRGFRQRAPPLRLAAHRRASRESACSRRGNT